MADAGKLKEEQKRVAGKVSITDDSSLKNLKTVAGVEQAFIEDKVISAVVVCTYKDFKILEKKHTITEAKIPYVKGLLFYREGPAIMEAFSKLEQKPNLLIVNGSGILHPRRVGMASHVGVLLDTPTIGVTKKMMMGDVREHTIYVDKEARGYELITKEHAKPIYVSPGHKISLKTSQEIIRKSIIYPHKLPEPLHLAHRHATKIRKDMVKEAT